MRIRQSNISTTDTNYTAGIRFKYIDYLVATEYDGTTRTYTMVDSDVDDCNMLVLSSSQDNTYPGQANTAMAIKILGHSSFTDKYILSHPVGLTANAVPHTQDYDSLNTAQTLSSDALRAHTDFVEIWAGPNGEGEDVIVLSKRVTAAAGGGGRGS
jgi:hypothetical protein